MERSLDIEVTRRCNLRCDYCFVGWSRGWTSDVPRDLAEEIVREGAGRFDLLHITGGEPFAWRGLLELIDLGLSLDYATALVNTNGTLLDDRTIARLAAHRARARISVSFDGPREVHDPVRGPGRFDEADDAVRRAIAAGVPVTIMTVVTKSVLARLPEFLLERWAAHPGLSGITLFPVGVGPTGTQKPGVPLMAFSPSDLELLAAHVTLAWRLGIRVVVAAYPVINPILRRLGYPEEMLYQCTAGRGRVCVHADRTVSPCHPVATPVYGTWSPGLFDRLPGFAAHARMRDRDYDGCSTCSQREGCGHCRAFVTASGAGFFGNDEICLDVVPGRRIERDAEPRAGLLGRENGRARRALPVVP
ncbi:radical SAM protein [Sorangium sp. So ce375]|uniref:radical SAM protein n=1 Tax=Sorangium sp. So ce375 TaxID=3133306 RepID=UPI003F5CAB24